MRLSSSRAALMLVMGSGVVTAGNAQQPTLTPTQVRTTPVPLAVVEAAVQYEAAIKTRTANTKGTAQQALGDARKLARVPATAAQAVDRFLDAVALDMDNAANWFELAEGLLAIPVKDQAKDGRANAANAMAAAHLGVTRAKTADARARGLYLLSQGLERRGLYRPAINVLKASLSNASTVERRAALVTLIQAHGFKYKDYRAETDAARPRVCLTFSEDLGGQKIDLDSFVLVNGKAAPAARIDGRQLCIDGLKHGESYDIRVRAGLPSVHADETLSSEVDIKVYLRDRTASVRTTGRAYVLPSTGQQGLPLVSINTEALALEVYRIGDRGLVPFLERNEFGRQLSKYDLANIREQAGRRVYEGELIVLKKPNEEVTTAFPVSEAISKLEPGLYLLSAQAIDEGRKGDRERATQWFVVTDIGIQTFTAADGLHVSARSLASAGPKGGVRVRLVAKNNEVLAEGTTDATGFVKFEPALLRGEGALQPQLVTVEGANGDYAFLDVAQAAFDLSDRGVTGRPAPGPLDAYSYTDRGVYRPGETVHLAALIRDKAANAASLPVLAIVTRPDGVEHARIPLADQGLGGRAHNLVLGRGAMTGTWRVKIHAEPAAPPLAQSVFLVEDFIPEKLELTLKPVAEALSLVEGGAIDLVGRYLYGPPAGGLGVEGELIIKAAKSGIAGQPGYQFGVAAEAFETVRQSLEALGTTAADGKLRVAVRMPTVNRTSRPLEAQVILKLRETGGRTIERSVSLPITTAQPLIGIKPRFENGAVPEGAVALFDVIHLDGSGKRANLAGAQWEVVRLDQKWQWYNRDGNWQYDSQTETQRIAVGSIDIAANAPQTIEARVSWGRYRLDLKMPNGDVVSSVPFNAGYWADEGADNPETLDVALDKKSYRVGETARVRVTSRMAGRALVTVLSGGILEKKEVDLPVGGGEVAIEVNKSWGPGAYVGVTLFRPLDAPQRRMPGRAVGMAWVSVDQTPRRLEVTLDVPKEVKPGQRLTVPLKLSGLAVGEEARVTLSAVDVGILNLTRFDAPKPESWFHGQRKLGVDLRDYYSRLIDGMRAERGRLRSGGDGAAVDSLSSAGAPPVEATLALFSGVVKVGPDGRADVAFDMPQFNGTVRLSAVAWSAEKVGSGSTDVLVRDDVAVTIAAPRFLTLGDKARLGIDLHNVTSAPKTFSLHLRRDGVGSGIGRAASASVALTDKTLTLAPGAKLTEVVTLEARDVGATPYTLELKGTGGFSISRSLTLDVKPPAGDIRRSTVVALKENGGSLTVSRDLAADMIPGTTKITVNVGPLAELDVPGLLTELDRYPYGCAEQTTSRAVALLYANEIAQRVGLGTDQALKARVDQAVGRVLEMQSTSGAFGIWGPRDGDMWLTSYVTDFLLRAREQGHAVPQRALTQALDRLRNSVVNSKAADGVMEGRAYALYVLARGGRGLAGELRYDADTRLEAFTSPLEKAQLGAALMLVGDGQRAETVFARAVNASVTAPPTDAARGDYGSVLRDRAALATLAAETRIKSVNVPDLLGALAKARTATRFTSTQEQAWMVLAARALNDAAATQALTINGAAHQGIFQRGLTAESLTETPLSIVNRGDSAVSAVVSVVGAALTPEPASAKGFTIERTFYELDGKPVAFASANGGRGQIKQNDRFVVVVKVKADRAGGRVLIVDKLPAGLEIENPRLIDGGDTKSLNWLTGLTKPEHTEFRDDRMVAAFNFSGRPGAQAVGDDDDDTDTPTPANGAVKSTTEVSVAYIVRAVTPGTFVHPAATVEDMYRPERYGRTAVGTLEVTAR